MVLEGAVDGEGPQAVVGTHLLLRCQHHPGFGGAVHDVPQGINQAGADARRHVVVHGPGEAGPLHRPRRAGPGQPLGAHQPGQVVAHWVDAAGGEAGDRPHLFGPHDLIGPQELGMLDDRSVVGRALGGVGLLDRREEVVHRLVADAVAGHLAVALPVGGHGGLHGGLGIHGQAAEVLLRIARRIVGVGLGHEGVVHAAVHPELHPRQPHPVEVTPIAIHPRRPRRRIGVLGDHGAAARLGLLQEGVLHEQQQVDRQQLLVEHLTGHIDVVIAEAKTHLGGRGLTIGRPEGHGLGHPQADLGRGEGGFGRQHRKHRRFRDVAVGLAAARLAGDHPSGRILAAGVPAHLFEQHRIDRTLVAGAVLHEHRPAGAHGVELLLGGVAVFGELFGPVAQTLHPHALRQGGGVGLHAPQQFGDALHAGQVGIEQGVAGQHQVAVGIDEARQQGAAGQVHLAGAASGGLEGPGQGPHIEDATVLLHQRFGVGGLGPRHGEDVATAVKGGGGRRRSPGADQTAGKAEADLGQEGGHGAENGGNGTGVGRRRPQRVGNSRVATARTPQPWGPLSGPSTQ